MKETNMKSREGHTVQNDGVTYELPVLPTTSDNYILLQNTDSKNVIVLEGVDGGYFGSDTQNIVNYNFEYKKTNFNSYVSTFSGEAYLYWTATDVGPSFNLSGYEIIYKSKDMYPVYNEHIIATLPEGVTWDDQIIISYSNGAYRLYKPANNIGMWIDEKNTNNYFVYRNTLTSKNETFTRYTYNTSTHTWTGKTGTRTEGYDYEIFYVGANVFSTDGTIIRNGQRDFYAQSSKSQEDDLIYDISSLLTNNSYIILKNTESKLLLLLIGEDDGYFGSDTESIWNYDSSYSIANFTASYISSFDGEEYGGWKYTNIGNSFSLSGYEIIYKSKDMYPVYNEHIIATLPEGVTWDDKIIISYSNGAYRLYKPANNIGMWVDEKNTNNDFVYRNTLTSKNETFTRYTYNTSTHTWTGKTGTRTEGYDYEIFYVGANVFSTDRVVIRNGQREFYAQSSKPQEDDLIYDLSSLLTNNSYIILKNTDSKLLLLLIGEDEGYFGSDTENIWNYNSSYNKTNFTASYISSFNGEEYNGWKYTNIGNSFSLSGYEIIYKSKDMYPVYNEHIIATLPEGVTWDDKIIISYSNGAYRLYKPEDNIGMWIDEKDTNNDFVYRDELMSDNETFARYTYNTNTHTWTSGTGTRTEGYDYEIFYVGANVFSTDGTIIREGQRDFYAQSSEPMNFQFEPLESSEAKKFLGFISNVPDSAIEEELPEYYSLLTGTIQNPQEELKVKMSFIIYLYYCLDIQLAQINERIEMGTTYLIKWVEENTQASTIIFGEIKDALWDNLKNTIAKSVDIPGISIGYDIATTIMDYGELVIHSIGSILQIQRADDIKYLRAYLKMLESEYENDRFMALYWKFTCETIVMDSTFGGNTQEMEKYAKYILSIEHSMPINPSTNLIQ